MKEIAKAEVDIAIIGGGVAGLWLLNRLRQLGYAAILLETKALGAGQTRLSQGIIHGGMKYALHGAMTTATQSIADMPGVWSECLHGKGVIDLSRVSVLSQYQYLWSTGSLSSKLAGFFSGLVLKGNVQALSKENFPAIFKNTQFKGHVYALDEMVVDVNELVRELAKVYQDNIYKVDSLTENNLHFDANDQLNSIEIQADGFAPVLLQAKRFIFTAGNGNEIVSKKLSHPAVQMQRRPLQMVVVKTDFSYSLYGHCLGLGATPRVTITTHKAYDGKSIWYLGGQIAEEGVKKSSAEQIQLVRNELKELFPWLDFSKAEFATFFVDRAEARQADGRRPDSCYVAEVGNIMVAWPTKLAFAPKLAEEIIVKIKNSILEATPAQVEALHVWPTPAVAAPIWDEIL